MTDPDPRADRDGRPSDDAPEHTDPNRTTDHNNPTQMSDERTHTPERSTDARPTRTQPTGRPAPPGSDRLSRRRFLAAAAATGAVVGLAGCSDSRDTARDSTTTTSGPGPGTTTDRTTTAPPTTTAEPPDPYFEQGETVAVERVADGLFLPNVFAIADEDRDRRFVCDQVGVVYVHEGDGLRDRPFLDITDRVVELGSNLPSWVSEDERGLLGLAFHPDFAANGRFFVRYSTDSRDSDPETVDHRERLSEFRAPGDRSVGDPDSETVLLDLPWYRPIHQAGSLAFGPEDGYLYAAYGDGLNPFNGQDIVNEIKGCIIRIDVDNETDEKPYGIPPDNPLVGRDGIDEYWAWGLRNPWKMSFEGGRLLVGDVGQELFEEVDVVEKGGNYGWPIKEGLHCHDPRSPGTPPDSCPDVSPRGEPLVDPVLEFPHFDDDGTPVGFAVIGGTVYEGDAVPALQGEYVFGAFTSDFATPAGRVLVATPQAAGQWPIRELRFADGDGIGINVLGFGKDRDGEVYVLGTEASVSEGGASAPKGAVYRIVPAQ